ncbi:MAG: pit accessory protein [Verrucomicrobia bacterium]|nr:pit accessory protein [Verrucomicrobiota bacterium]
MNVLTRLVGRDDKFFNLLEASAGEAQTSVHLLVDMMKHPEGNLRLDEFAEARRKDKRITEQITEELCVTFVTPLEREDIERLSFALYKIPKTVEKFSERFMICRNQLVNLDFSKQLALLGQATETVATMVQMLRNSPRLDAMKELNSKLHQLEGDADKIMVSLITELYSGKYDTLKVIVTADLYELLERVIDRCRDAGNIVFQIVLKYS